MQCDEQQATQLQVQCDEQQQATQLPVQCDERQQATQLQVQCDKQQQATCLQQPLHHRPSLQCDACCGMHGTWPPDTERLMQCNDTMSLVAAWCTAKTPATRSQTLHTLRVQ